MENYTYPPPPPPPAASAVLHYRLISKYLLLIPGQHPISRDAALLAGLAALHDLDEIITRQADARLDDWRNRHHDQAATISDLENALDDAVQRIETHRDSAQLWRTQYDISQTQLNEVEIECARLKTLTNESSSPTTATMEPSAPAASNTSKPQDPTPPSPAASSTASGGAGERVLSARTLRRRKMAPQTQPVDEGAGDFFDPATALAEVLSPDQINGLEAGQKRWGDLLPAVQGSAILRIAETIYGHLGTISQTLYNRHKPQWASSVASWTKTADLQWQDVLNHLHVQPSNLPISFRIVRTASQP